MEHKILRRLFNQGLAKPLTSLQTESRIMCADDTEAYFEYGFIPRDVSGWTDEDIEEWLNDFVRIPYRWSAYDCTGQRFTQWLDWHRNPSGKISFVHRVGLDV